MLGSCSLLIGSRSFPTDSDVVGVSPQFLPFGDLFFFRIEWEVCRIAFHMVSILELGGGGGVSIYRVVKTQGSYVSIYRVVIWKGSYAVLIYIWTCYNKLKRESVLKVRVSN